MFFGDYSEFKPSNSKCLVKKLKGNAILPKQGSKYAAGYDLYACIDNPITINPHCTEMIGTGLAFRPPINHFGAIFARSGLATKQGLRPANCVGVCDEDYTGEYIVAVHNDCDIKRTIKPGDRIAQLVFLPYESVSFVEVSELSYTDRGNGGFGHTGTN
jgi:dUTP pyrophosphatase